MKQYLKWLEALTDCISISGFEQMCAEGLREHLSAAFSLVETDTLGTLSVTKKAKDPSAPTLLIDAHFDQIGMMVTGHKKGGFLTVTPIGGLDSRVLPASDVTVWGTRPVFGVVTSTPPHLRKPEDADKLKPVSELLIDVGYRGDDLEALVPLGAPVSFRTPLTELAHGRYAGMGLDNKACGAAALAALEAVSEADLAYHVTVQLSSFEEVGGRGAVTSTVRHAPDYAVVLDVNFADAPGVEPDDAIKMDKGPSVSLSVLTDRVLTRRVIALAKERELPLQTVVEVGNLGTNGNQIPLQLCGIPTVNMSLPLTSMHTASEIVSAADGQAMADLLVAMMTDSALFRKECDPA